LLEAAVNPSFCASLAMLGNSTLYASGVNKMKLNRSPAVLEKY
jgi:hypothetical protein